MKKLFVILCLLLTVGCSDNSGFSISELPEEYLSECHHAGMIDTLEYDTTIDNKTYHKTVNIYIPYKYDKNKTYKTFYLNHGYGGGYKTFLGTQDNPRDFKHILDHMIDNEEIDPIIVVCPEMTLDNREMFTDYSSIYLDEVVDIVIPLIEKNYSVGKNRSQRIVGGFSMGGYNTWHFFEKYPDIFQYYLPMSSMHFSMGVDNVEDAANTSSETLANMVEKTNIKDFIIFSATGSKDFLKDSNEAMINALYDYPDIFTKENVYFHIWNGRKHSFKQSMPYLYNGLLYFKNNNL